VLAACKALLWSTLSQAAVDLTAEFGNASVASWQRQIADEDVRHTAAGVTTVPAIDWQNRPTFQQVVQIPVGLCGTAPAAGCKTPIAPGTSQLQLKNRPIDAQDRSAGSGIAAARRPSPTSAIPRRRRATTSASTPATRSSRARPRPPPAPAAAAARAGARRRRAGRTRSRPRRPRPPEGHAPLRRRRQGEAAGEGKGGLLSLPRCPLVGTPVRAQMVNSDGKCWEATYSNPSRNDSDRFKSKSD
jgi:hypothetical protein